MLSQSVPPPLSASRDAESSVPSPAVARQEKDMSGKEGLQAKRDPALGIHWPQDFGQASALRGLRWGLSRSSGWAPGHSRSGGPCRGRWVMAQGDGTGRVLSPRGAAGCCYGGCRLHSLPPNSPTPGQVPGSARPAAPAALAGGGDPHPECHPPLSTHGVAGPRGCGSSAAGAATPRSSRNPPRPLPAPSPGRPSPAGPPQPSLPPRRVR